MPKRRTRSGPPTAGATAAEKAESSAATRCSSSARSAAEVNEAEADACVRGQGPSTVVGGVEERGAELAFLPPNKRSDPPPLFTPED